MKGTATAMTLSLPHLQFRDAVAAEPDALLGIKKRCLPQQALWNMNQRWAGDQLKN
jgi:hypothetical protein